MRHPRSREQHTQGDDGWAQHPLIMIGRPMNPSNPAPRCRLRSALAPLAVGVLLVALSACGSDIRRQLRHRRRHGRLGGGRRSAGRHRCRRHRGSSTLHLPADTVAGDTVPSGTVGGGDDTAVCGGLSAADVGAAVGAEFDAADDISVDADLSCLFSNSTATDGVTVMTESADTYLGGSLAGLPIEDALAQLETAQSMFLDEGYTVEQTTIGGVPAIVIGGTNSVAVIPTGYAATVVDGVVIEVTLDGANLVAGCRRTRPARRRRARTGCCRPGLDAPQRS